MLIAKPTIPGVYWLSYPIKDHQIFRFTEDNMMIACSAAGNPLDYGPRLDKDLVERNHGRIKYAFDVGLSWTAVTLCSLRVGGGTYIAPRSGFTAIRTGEDTIKVERNGEDQFIEYAMQAGWKVRYILDQQRDLSPT